jgi:hypothetical protein
LSIPVFLEAGPIVAIILTFIFPLFIFLIGKRVI